METWEVKRAADKAELLAESIVRLVRQGTMKHARRAGNELGLVVVGTQRRLLAESNQAPRATVEQARRLALAWRSACAAMKDGPKVAKVDEWIARLDALLLIGPVKVQKRVATRRRWATAAKVAALVLGLAWLLALGALFAYSFAQATIETPAEECADCNGPL